MTGRVGLSFDRGTVVVTGGHDIPLTEWDERARTNRALALHYPRITAHLNQAGIPYDDTVLDLVPCPELSCDHTLRPYQRDALDRWLADRRGVLVLPTGSGKTVIGMKAIEHVNQPAFVVVPTLDLVDQWRSELAAFGIPIGEYTGREKRLEPVTVATYDSAYAHGEHLGNRFALIVFDEVHHLAAEGYQHIAELFASPARLGLTATYERADDRHETLPRLLGGKVYEIDTDELTGEYLAEYTVERITVTLTPAEQAAYDDHHDVFTGYLRSANIQLRHPSDYQKIVLRSGNDPAAWRAVRARTEARKIAYSATAKLDELARLLDRHHGDRIIIFTRYNDLVHAVSDRFLIPGITHKTPTSERRTVLRMFKAGEYPAIVSSNVLDEGVDVPAANVGVILSGTGSTREYRQRLGRILRPTPDDSPARLYEIVTADTAEVRTADRRRS